MLGILLFVLVIGRSYFLLATRYGKKEWLYVVLGVASYYLGSFLLTFLVGILLEFFNPGYVDTLNVSSIDGIGIVFGVLSCILFYQILKWQWKKSKARKQYSEIIDDID